ncbi:MAG: hypothetical protein NZ602_11815 [Thermoguttaceae bacterium]|nr:hypothetical protein [Thermoguttaceae bacterium]MDW8038647.1 hypothetical protein [Thermoguttaceae bacterium]
MGIVILWCVGGWVGLAPWEGWAEQPHSDPPLKEQAAVSHQEPVAPRGQPSAQSQLVPSKAGQAESTQGSHQKLDPALPDASSASTKAREPERTGPTIQTPRDLLELFGIDQSQFRRLTDGVPLAEGEEELLLKLLSRSAEFPVELLERWAHRQINLPQVAGKPEEHRGEIYWLTGRVQRMQICQPAPEVAERFLTEQYYRCELRLDPSDQPAIVYVRTVPKAWLKKPPENERSGFLGLLLKTTSSDPQKPIPIFAAHRIAWYPAGLLGDLGMDVGLLDLVVDRQSLLSEERETFYQFLAAMRRANPEQIFQVARWQVQQQGRTADSVVPLFKEPTDQRGRLVLLRGAAKEVTLVHVSDPDIRTRFGIDHYYKIALFTPDSQDNPLFICVPSLPRGMPTGEGIQYVEEVEVAAFFLKSWSYRVRPPEDVPPEKRSDMIVWKRQAPLLIGVRPIWYPRPQANPHTVAAIVAGLLFVIAGIGLWWAVWRAHRKDEQFRRRFLAKTTTQSPPSILSVRQQQEHVEPAPDFPTDTSTS